MNINETQSKLYSIGPKLKSNLVNDFDLEGRPWESRYIQKKKQGTCSFSWPVFNCRSMLGSEARGNKIVTRNRLFIRESHVISFV